MSVDRDVVQMAAQLVAIANGLQNGRQRRSAETTGPISWPQLTADEAAGQWDDLRHWVARLRERFPNAIRLPDCWWRHNDLVEVLAALRDFERGCFALDSPATASVEWQRALRDMEARMDIWIKRFGCNVPGRGHDPPQYDEAVPPGWDEFVANDEQRRRASPPTQKAASDK